MIEANIPMPKKYKGVGGRVSRYPFVEMQVGDSVFFEGEKMNGAAHSSALKYAKRHGVSKFTAKTMDGGIRIWRVS